MKAKHLLNLIYILLIQLFAPNLQAQVGVIKDIFPGAVGSNPSGYTLYNGITYFAATDPTHGRELWRTDGTTVGTYLVKDINPGLASSNPKNFFVFSDTLVFAANDGVHGNELWYTTGTTANTALAHDFNVGSGDGNPVPADTFQNKLIVGANNGFHYGAYASDACVVFQTEMLQLTWGTCWADATFGKIGKLNNHLFLDGFSITQGGELYKWDGSNPPVLVKDINPGIDSSHIKDFFLFNDTLYFQANDGVHGAELWRTDGTSSGTVLVKDFNTGGGDGNPTPVDTFQNKIILTANNGSTNDFYVHDYIGDYNWNGPPLTIINGGTGANKTSTIYNNNFYFNGFEPSVGSELYKWDGINPPSLVSDINPGPASSNPRNLNVFKDRLIFIADGLTIDSALYNFNINTNQTEKCDLVEPMSTFDISKLLANGGGAWKYVPIGGRTPEIGNELISIRSVMKSLDSKAEMTTVRCAGNANNSPFATAWDFLPGNTFTAQLSDANGNFGSPINIGSVNAISDTNIVGIIPNSTPLGLHYRIRIISTMPADTSLPSDNEIKIENVGCYATVFTGTQDQNWNNANNWIPNGIPTSGTNVEIQYGPGQVIIPSGYDAQTNNLTMAFGATLKANPASSLSTSGKFNTYHGSQVTFLSRANFIQTPTSTQDSAYGLIKSSATIASSPDFFYKGVFKDRGTTLTQSSPALLYRYNPNSANLANSSDPGWTIVNNTTTQPGAYFATNLTGINFSDSIIKNGIVFQPIFSNPFPQSSFNLIGNPYLSNILADDFLVANLNINGGVYFWDDDHSGGTNYSGADYAVYNLSGGIAGGGNNIPSGNISTFQGFWVYALNSGNVRFDNSMRTNGASQLLRTNNSTQRIWLNLEAPNKKSQTLIAFHQMASDSIDRLFDSPKIFINPTAIYSLNNQNAYAIQGFAPIEGYKQIPIGLKAANGEIFTLSIDSLENFDANSTIFLQDISTGSYVNLREQNCLYLGTGDFENNRFVLHINPIITAVNNDAMPGNSNLIISNNPTTGNSFGLLHSKNSEAIFYKVFDSLGKIIKSGTSQTDVRFEVISLNDNSGIYFLETKDENGNIYRKKLIKH